MYSGVDVVQLDRLDVVNETSVRRHRGVELVDAAPQAGHVSVQALFEPPQAVGKRVQANTDPLQLGESLVQAVAGPPALPHLGHKVVPDDVNLFVQISKPSLRVVDMLCQLVLQVGHLEDTRETCGFVYIQ